jgi:hypothetical protein
MYCSDCPDLMAEEDVKLNVSPVLMPTGDVSSL